MSRISITYNNESITFTWDTPQNMYDLVDVLINGEVIIPSRIKNKTTPTNSFFVIKTNDLYFTINNNTVNGHHKTLGVFNGKLNEVLPFSISPNRNAEFVCNCHD